jgi:hypothetical protein
MARALVAVLVLAASLAAGASPAARARPRADTTPDRPVASMSPIEADFNEDGFFDVAIGAPGEDVGGAADAGAVDIFWGTPDGGLSSAPYTIVQDRPEPGDRFGAALTAGSFNFDQPTDVTDLVIGAPGEDVGAKVDAGVVNIFYGTASGLPTYGQTLLQGTPEAGDRFGAALTTGPFNREARPDLVVGAPGEDRGARVDAGAATYFYNNGFPLGAGSSQVLLQDRPEIGDRFGAAFTVGRFNRDLYLDLVIGAPGENVGRVVDAGAVSVFYDSGRGLGAGHLLLQDRPEAGDRFGAALTPAHLTDHEGFDLVVGAPGENVGAKVDAGAANLFENTIGVLPATPTQTLLQDNPEAGDRFGTALVVGSTSGCCYDVVVGAPGEDVRGRADAGAASLFNATSGHLPVRSSQTLLQNNPEAGDRFGAALVVPLFWSGDEQPDLVVGAPGEDVSAKVDAGAATVFVNTTGSLPSTSGLMLRQAGPSAGNRLGAAFES